MTTPPGTLQSPYASAGPHWLRGALHLHSTSSDGTQAPDETLRDYERHGFDFAVLTDHNVVPADTTAQACTRMLCLPGCEYRARPNEPELGITGVRTGLPLNVTDAVAMAAVRAQNAFVVYNHPNWHFDHWPSTRMLALRAANAHLIRFIAERGQVRAETRGTQAQYTLRADDVYVRVEIFGAGATKAWTNPVFVESDARRALVEEFRTWFLQPS